MLVISYIGFVDVIGVDVDEDMLLLFWELKDNVCFFNVKYLKGLEGVMLRLDEMVCVFLDVFCNE